MAPLIDCSTLTPTAHFFSSPLGTAVSSASTNPNGNKGAFTTPKGPRLCILLVEDNLVNQKVAKRLLECDGHTVIIANHGKEALDLRGENSARFDAVLMDLQMPVMDGLTATRHIRPAEAIANRIQWGQSSRVLTQIDVIVEPTSIHTLTVPATPAVSRRIPIIAVTASALEEDSKRCMESGFDDIIHKSIDIHLLSKKIGQLILQKMEKMQTTEADAAFAGNDVLCPDP